jgi:hypothetical protein
MRPVNRPTVRSATAGLVALHGALFLGAFVYGWSNLDSFARLTYSSWPPCSGIDSCDPGWQTSQLTWSIGFLLAGLAGQFLLLAAAGLWFRSRWSGTVITILSALELLLAIRLLIGIAWWLGLALLPLPIAEVILLRAVKER